MWAGMNFLNVPVHSLVPLLINIERHTICAMFSQACVLVNYERKYGKFPKSSELLRFCELSFIARFFCFWSYDTSNSENGWKVFNRTYIFLEQSFKFLNNINKRVIIVFFEWFFYALKLWQTFWKQNIYKQLNLLFTHSDQSWVENQSSLNKQYSIESANNYNVSI